MLTVDIKHGVLQELRTAIHYELFMKPQLLRIDNAQKKVKRGVYSKNSSTPLIIAVIHSFCSCLYFSILHMIS